MLTEGNDPNARDDNGWTPLHFSTQANSAAVSTQLLLAGAEINLADSNGNTPLSNAVFNFEGSGELITLLRAHGADPYKQNNYGVSPLELARNNANEEIAELFSDLLRESTLRSTRTAQ